MSKIIIVLIAFLLGGICGTYFSYLGIGFQILITLGFIIGWFIIEAILFFGISAILVLPVNKNKTVEKQSKFYRRLLRFYSVFLFDLFGMKIIFHGKEKLKDIDQFVLIGNHRSNLDSMILDVYLKDYPLVFCTKKSLFKVPYVGRLIHACGYIKLDRKNINNDHQSIEEGIDKAIENNWSIGIFPEGTRKIDRGIHSFHEGSFIIPYELKCPLVISVLRGTHEVNHNLLLKRHTVYCDIVKVINYDEYKDLSKEETAKLCANVIEKFLEENPDD